MFWDKEKLLSATVKPKPKYHDRIIDKKDNYTIVDDKNGEKITLEEHKRKYPYKIDKNFICYAKTTHRKFSFTIPVEYTLIKTVKSSKILNGIIFILNKRNKKRLKKMTKPEIKN